MVTGGEGRSPRLLPGRILILHPSPHPHTRVSRTRPAPLLLQLPRFCATTNRSLLRLFFERRKFYTLGDFRPRVGFYTLTTAVRMFRRRPSTPPSADVMVDWNFHASSVQHGSPIRTLCVNHADHIAWYNLEDWASKHIVSILFDNWSIFRRTGRDDASSVWLGLLIL